MKIFFNGYRETEYLKRHARVVNGQWGTRLELDNHSVRNTSGVQGACKAYYLALEGFRDRVKAVFRAVKDGVEGVAVEMETSEPGTRTVVFITEVNNQVTAWHSDELRPNGTKKNPDYTPGCQTFGRSAKVDYIFCYHLAAAFVARALALHLDDELESNLRGWWAALDRGKSPLDKSRELEVAADALYYHLRDMEESLKGAYLEDVGTIQVLADLTPDVLGRVANPRLLPAAPVTSSSSEEEAQREEGGSGIDWPEGPHLSDEEKVLVPTGITYYPFGDELVDIATHIRLMREAGMPANILLLGDAGTAKTTLVRYVAQQMRTPLLVVNCASTVDEASLIGGNYKVDGEWRWVDGDLITAARKGWMVCFEEVRVLPPEVASYIHNLLDESRRVTLAECADPQLRHVVAHPKFVVFGTANDGEAYLTAKEMDLAWRTRWHIIRMRELPEQVRVKILVERTGLTQMIAGLLVQVQDQLMRQYKDRQITFPCDMRTLLDWGMHTQARGGSVPAAWRASIHCVVEKVAASAEEQQAAVDVMTNVLGQAPDDVRALFGGSAA